MRAANQTHLIDLQAINQIQKKWNSYNSSKQFVIKAIVCVIIWKLIYTSLLAPTRIIDQPLTKAVAHGTAWAINLFSDPKLPKAEAIELMGYKKVMFMNVIRQGRTLISIADACNGLELTIMYAGLILLLPQSKNRKIIYVLGGIIVLYLTNVLRCVGLQWVYVYHRAYFESSHHYLFTLAMYVVIFAGWASFVNAPKQPATSSNTI